MDKSPTQEQIDALNKWLGQEIVMLFSAQIGPDGGLITGSIRNQYPVTAELDNNQLVIQTPGSRDLVDLRDAKVSIESKVHFCQITRTVNDTQQKVLLFCRR